MLKVTMDKALVTVAQVPNVRAWMKDFSAAYTPGDLKNAFVTLLEKQIIACTSPSIYSSISCSAEIISCKVTAFPKNNDNLVEVVDMDYRVEMILETYNAVYQVYFYTDHNLNVNTSVSVAPWGADVAWGVKIYGLSWDTWHEFHNAHAAGERHRFHPHYWDKDTELADTNVALADTDVEPCVW